MLFAYNLKKESPLHETGMKKSCKMISNLSLLLYYVYTYITINYGRFIICYVYNICFMYIKCMFIILYDFVNNA